MHPFASILKAEGKFLAYFQWYPKIILKSSVEDDTEMKQIDDEKQVDGMSQGKESNVSSTLSRMESVRNGK